LKVNEGIFYGKLYLMGYCETLERFPD